MLACLAARSATAENSLELPQPGYSRLRVLTPRLLELTLINTKPPNPARVISWDLVRTNGEVALPGVKDLIVLADGKPIAIEKIGFKRRPIYAPLKRRDLRIENDLYLILGAGVPDGAAVELKNPSAKLWSPVTKFVARFEPLRFSPLLHVNQESYAPSQPKKAMVGFYLGNLGELEITNREFSIVDTQDRVVFTGTLNPRLDVGYEYEPLPYQKVLEANFTPFNVPGAYRLAVPGLGSSFSFLIDDGAAALMARTYALGLYHQRCGTSNAFPWTRFTHGPCHTNLVEIPTMKFEEVNRVLANMSSDFSAMPRHKAPRLENVAASLYPFVRTNKIDVSGGHHDAGDYSKYTINSAQLIHTLVFAADAFPGVGDLDNLGLPESGDGKSDVLQEAKWELDFLLKMQDTDGGFYFLVYPRDREYEDNVLPDHGDPQIVFPKTTSATAAAVAALAQSASSPLMKKQFPEEAARYLSAAKSGWEFLRKAIAKYGRDGAYQKITHYGNEFLHDDELAWAETEMYLAIGDENLHQTLVKEFDPASRETRRWSWVRAWEGYGCALRSYAFAARSGRVGPGKLDPRFLRKCEDELIAAADDQTRFAAQTAYATSFPDPTKRFRQAGWYFSMDRAFDIAVAMQLDFPSAKDPRDRYLDAIWGNLNFEAGCNPVNMTFVTGIGWRRQRETVHQFAQNDRRVLPPTGIPLGNLQEGFPFLDLYQRELGELTFPSDGAKTFPYPPYDRWGDTFNTSTEFVEVNQARGLAVALMLMAKSPLKNQTWKSVAGKIQSKAEQPESFEVVAPGVDLAAGRVVWERSGAEPVLLRGNETYHSTKGATIQWMEAEATLPDGRRIFATREFSGKR
jgi:hypothetical protein